MKRRALAFIALLASCTKDPTVVSHAVTVYSPRSCPVSESSAFSVFYGAGDFEPSPSNPPMSRQFLRSVGQTMASLPDGTRSLIVDVSDGDQSWRGVGDVQKDATNVLVWRASQSCRLTQDVERRTDMAFGVFGRHFMVVGGTSDGSTPPTYVGDLSTGAIVRLPFGLALSRTGPTVTAFAEGALVAGGSAPDSKAPIATAEVYDATAGDFDPTKIDLSEGRTQHGAVVLGTGETLLVGGRGASGPLRTMEIVDPLTHRAHTSGVATLTVPRISPTVLRLASGEVLVAGGVDAAGALIPTLEWFSPDASQPSKRPTDLVTGKQHQFVALEAGGALAVILPDNAAPDFKTVWSISADGTLEPAQPIDPSALATVRLFSGASNAPVLWTGNAWMRWSPWEGTFEAMTDAPTNGPSLDATANGDPGLALWLDDSDGTSLAVTGFRFDAKTPFDAVQNPLLVAGPTSLAPDRLVGLGVRFDGAGLVLGPGGSAFVTDATFADFALDVDVTSGPPLIVVRDGLGSEIQVGGVTCAFGQSATRSLRVLRHDRFLSVSADGGAEKQCPTLLNAGARVTVGIRGGSTPASARNLRVIRL